MMSPFDSTANVLRPRSIPTATPLTAIGSGRSVRTQSDTYPTVGLTSAGCGQDATLELGGRFLGTDWTDPWEYNGPRLDPYGIVQPKVICSALLLELGEADPTAHSPGTPICLAGTIEIAERLLVCAFGVFRPPRAVARLLLPGVPHAVQFHGVRHRSCTVASRPGLQCQLDPVETPVPSISSSTGMRRELTSLDVGRVQLVAERLIDDHDVVYQTHPTTAASACSRNGQGRSLSPATRGRRCLQQPERTDLWVEENISLAIS